MTTTTETPADPGAARRPSARLCFGVAFPIGLILTLGIGVGGM
ncbi:MAG: hypothetical protein QOE66_1452 [Chloroflexota bacterium]|jgi:hypothetical protein|nr:hypothetical protein [Chloroflexota bacterium]